MKRQLENTESLHWIMATATALGSIKRLAEQQQHYVDHTRDQMRDEQEELARRITRNLLDDNYPTENTNAEEIERARRSMEEYRANIAAHEALRDAYQAAAAIIEATTGEYHYAAHTGYYKTSLKKFETREERDAYLEANEGWRAATDEDMNLIFWGQVLPTKDAPEA